MKIILIEILKLGLRIAYAPIKLCKTRNRIVYLSRQSNDKSIDMQLLEQAVSSQLPDTEQVFRLRMIPDGFAEKIKYCLAIFGDMYYLATSKVAVTDTYSISVSCLKHKKSLEIIQIWHALGALKKFGLQSVGTKEGRDERVSKAMCMHHNYNYVLAPSASTAKFYMEAFGCGADKIKICSLPRVDELLADNGAAARFYKENPAFINKKIVLYLPTFRDREVSAANELMACFEEIESEYNLIISGHPLFSKLNVQPQYSYNGKFSTYDLMKVADVIITDYSACAFEASLLMKPLFFYVPDYDEYASERGLNIDLREEMPDFTFEDAKELVKAVADDYDLNKLYAFKSKYVENAKANNSEILAKFIAMLINSKEA